MMMNDLSRNNTLLEKCLEGDPRAQFMLYRNYSAAMYNIAVRITGNKMDAEDILQESFVTAFEKMGELENLSGFANWLKRIIINNAVSLVRKRRFIFEDLPGELNVNEPADDDFDEEMDPAVVHEAIKELPDGSRTVLVLYALEGYRHREISEMMGISESTSKSQYRRALLLLNRSLRRKVYAE